VECPNNTFDYNFSCIACSVCFVGNNEKYKNCDICLKYKIISGYSSSSGTSGTSTGLIPVNDLNKSKYKIIYINIYIYLQMISSLT